MSTLSKELSFDKITLGQEYEKKSLAYSRLANEVKLILENTMKLESLDVFEVITRVKPIDTFFNKIQRKNIVDDFFDKIEDIAGIRVVCKYYSQVEFIGKHIAEKFQIIREDKKTAFNRIDQFGYLSDHYIVKLKNETTKETEKDLLELKCEIQVRTLLMHSWATVSHELDYKKDEPLDEEIKREMYAISGLLYVADQRFDAYRNTMIRKTKTVRVEETPTYNLKQNITPDKLIEYLEKKFVDRSNAKTSDYIALSDELNEMKYNTFEKLDAIINKSKNILEDYEKKFPPESRISKYNKVGATRICVGIADTEHDKNNNFYVIDLDKYREKLPP